VKVIKYNYEYVYVEFSSGIHYSSFYPMLVLGQPSSQQQYFENGRNIRLGTKIDFTQCIKIDEWCLGTGISYMNYHELFSYNEYEIRQVTIQDQDGSLRTETVAVGEPVPYKRRNQLGYLVFPIKLEYYPEKLTGLGLGVSFNFHRLITADYMVKYAINQPAVSISTDQFHPWFYSFSVNFVYQHKVFKNLYASIEPYFEMSIKNLADQPDLSFGLNSAGLRTGFALYY
jgi:hypothetical protein